METKILPALDFILQEEGQKKIDQAKLITFLEESGFHQTEIEGKVKLVRISENLARESSVYDIAQFLRSILEREDAEACSIFLKNPGSYVGNHKFLSLKRKEILDDRDTADSCRFYFQNCFCEITSRNITVKDYEFLDSPVWANRIIQRSYLNPSDKITGQFENFCKRITGGDNQRFIAFQSWVGYLLHRNRDRGENKAVILYDEKMGEGDTANGRTGKSLMGEVFKKVREVVDFNGKELKKNSVFKNQRITYTSDLLFYDDYTKNEGIEHLYSILTTGIEVEKKSQPAFYIERSKAPKLLLTSNYYIPGDGGDSDMARRYEFEITNYFSRRYKPEHEFGNMFFTDTWPTMEWNKFYYFLFQCVRTYLAEGLIEAEPINLYRRKLISSTDADFEEFAEAYFLVNERQDKRELLENFQAFFPNHKDSTINMFTRWSKIFAHQKGYLYKDKSSGGNYYCWFLLEKDNGKKPRRNE